MEYRIRTARGAEKTVEGYGELIRDEAGISIAVGGTVLDVTEQKTAQQALAENERTLSRAQEIAKVGSWAMEIATGEVVWSNELKRIFGLDPFGPGLEEDEYYRHVHPADIEDLQRAVAEALEGETPMKLEYRIITKSGGTKTIQGFGEFDRDDSGEPAFFRGTIQDISEQRRTEQQLVQAQKMETIGQLSAGIAHDFNNMLAVMMGNLEMIQTYAESRNELTELAENALEAGAHGANLTKRLLAFARRQTMFPEPTPVNVLIEDMMDLLKSSIGQRIELIFEPGEDLWPVMVDPGQLEAALMNLAVNARDAMPDGGSLMIMTDNIDGIQSIRGGEGSSGASQYVCIDITDTGNGMTREVMDRAIEPFFTTKPMSEGSGLGLSMVHGFVHQTDGIFNIASQEGAGTTVRMFLPRSEAVQPELSLLEPRQSEPGSGQKVLIVEDDASVINVVGLQVRALGYRTLEASSAEEALEVLQSEADIALMLTDVILGSGMNGAELALEALEFQPDLKVLCMSGYAEPETFARYTGGADLPLIEKPFTRAKLGARLEELMRTGRDGSSNRAQPSPV